MIFCRKKTKIFFLVKVERDLSCLNIGGPPSKPKYFSITDSEQVPWGKGEKNPLEGSEIESWNSILTINRSLLKDHWFIKNLLSQSNGVPFA